MKTILIAAIIFYVAFELFEHVVLPLLFSNKRRQNKQMNGQAGMIGKVVEVKEWNEREGQVSINGEIWRAVSSAPLVPRGKAVIQDINGLTLKVEMLNRNSGDGITEVL